MDPNIARVGLRLGLEANAHPTVRFVPLLETPGRHGIGKGEKLCRRAPLLIEPFDQELVFVVEHCRQPPPTYIPVSWSIDRIAHHHVVGGNGFGDRSRRCTHPKEPARDLLPSADFCKRSVLRLVPVDVQCLMMGIQRPFSHSLRLNKAQVRRKCKMREQTSGL